MDAPKDIEERSYGGLLKTATARQDQASSTKTVASGTDAIRELPKGSCTIVHRGQDIVLRNSPGKRIVSVKFDVSRSDRDPLGKAYIKLMAEFDRSGAPAIHESELLAKWYDPSDSTVKMRLLIPHANYASWRENSFASIASTRARQKIDDRLEITFDEKLEKVPTSPTRPNYGSGGTGKTAVINAPMVPADGYWDVDAVRRAGRPSGIRQIAILLVCMTAISCFGLLGGYWLVAIAPPAVWMLFDTAIYARSMDRWKAVSNMDGTASDPKNASIPPPPAFAEEWNTIRKAVMEHAPQDAEKLARAEMRIRSLVETQTPMTNPIVIESIVRIGNGLSNLVAAYRKPASIATGDELRSLAERLTESVCALGTEAEDARVVAFRDAMFQFDTTTRYIESKNDPALRTVDESENADGP